jgi:hypothetical protein
MNDPNIQRDLTHAHNGIRLAKKIGPVEMPDHKAGGEVFNDVINLIRDREIEQARRFGQEYRRRWDDE